MLVDAGVCTVSAAFATGFGTGTDLEKGELNVDGATVCMASAASK